MPGPGPLVTPGRRDETGGPLLLVDPESGPTMTGPTTAGPRMPGTTSDVIVPRESCAGSSCTGTTSGAVELPEAPASAPQIGGPRPVGGGLAFDSGSPQERLEVDALAGSPRMERDWRLDHILEVERRVRTELAEKHPGCICRVYPVGQPTRTTISRVTSATIVKYHVPDSPYALHFDHLSQHTGLGYLLVRAFAEYEYEVCTGTRTSFTYRIVCTGEDRYCPPDKTVTETEDSWPEPPSCQTRRATAQVIYEWRPSPVITWRDVTAGMGPDLRKQIAETLRKGGHEGGSPDADEVKEDTTGGGAPEPAKPPGHFHPPHPPHDPADEGHGPTIPKTPPRIDPPNPHAVPAPHVPKIPKPGSTGSGGRGGRRR